jgi:hypothetical protein
MAGPNYSLPSWLEGDPTASAKNWLSGVQIGAAIGEAKNKLKAQQQQFAVEAQQKQDQVTASALKEAQELQVSKAYNDQQVSLKQQQLKIADEKVGAEIQKAARQFQAQQAYQKDFESGVQSGLSEDEAAKSAMFKNLSMFGSTGGGAMARSLTRGQNQAGMPQFVTDPVSGARLAANPVTGRFIHLQQPKTTGNNLDWLSRHDMTRSEKLQDMQVQQLTKRRDAMQKIHDADEQGAMASESQSKEPMSQRKAATYRTRQQQIDALDNQISSLLRGSQDWQGDYTPVQRGQAQPSGGSTGVYDFDPKSGGLIPRQSAPPSQEEAPKRFEDEILNEILQQYPDSDQKVSQGNQSQQTESPATQAAPADVQSQPQVKADPTTQAAPQESPLSVTKARPLGYDTSSTIATTQDRDRTKRSLSAMSAQKLMQAAKAIGLDWEIYYDGGDAFRYNDHKSTARPKSLKRSKLESLIRDAADEKQLVIQ